jgi:hypothetical protein
MKRRMAVGVCAMMLAAVVFVHAAETPDQPKKKAPAARLTQPWSKISTLSDGQKIQIREIHAKALADKRAVEAKEREDILALLSDEQKAEAQKLMDEQRKPKASVQARESDGDTAPAAVAEKQSAPAE